MTFKKCMSIWGSKPPKIDYFNIPDMPDEDEHVPTPDDWDLEGGCDDSKQLED